MDRGAWQAAVHGVARVGHDLPTKQPPHMELPLCETKIMASSPITLWQIDGETVETMRDYFFGPQNHCRW